MTDTLRPEGLHRLANRLYERKLLIPARVIQAIIFLLFHAVLPAEIRIGEGTIYAHGGLGVVLSKGSRIGSHVLIGHGVTIGGRSRQPCYPIVEDDVYIGAGAMVLGGVTVGHHSIVGANAVVLDSFPPHSIVAGVPARLIKSVEDPRAIEIW